jgi:hypothetical protein
MTHVIHGTDEGETLPTYSTNDVIHGYGGDDTINAGNGSDTLIGGAGSDYLEGGNGNDVYIWNPGDGNDTINDYSYYKSYDETGVLKIGEGVDPSEIEITRSGNDIIFIISETGERLTVQNWHSGAVNQLTSIEFADGTVWTPSQVNAMTHVLRGTDAGETLPTYSTNDVIHGYGGDDTINAGNGSDILIGGAGSDYLEGGNGQDIYIWNPGDGNDTINDYSYYKSYDETGVLKIGEGVDPSEIEVTRSGNDIIFIISETGESLTVQSWYSGVNYQLTNVEFGDGTIWTRANVNAISAGTLEPFSTASYSASFTAGLSGWGNWDSYSSLAAIMGGSQSESAAEYDTAQLEMDIAVAGLYMNSEFQEQSGDIASNASPYAGGNTIAASYGNSTLNTLDNYFSNQEGDS